MYSSLPARGKKYFPTISNNPSVKATAVKTVTVLVTVRRMFGEIAGPMDLTAHYLTTGLVTALGKMPSIP